MKPVKINDPLVSLEEALEVVGGSQQRLADLLDVKRQAVHGWIQRGLKHLPKVHGYRWRKHYGMIERQEQK